MGSNFPFVAMKVDTVNTSPISGQKTGTSGLRKRVKVFQEENYLNNWLQSLFNALLPDLEGQTLVVGGDGRYWNDVAIQTIIKMAAANGVQKLLVGQNGILSTPAVSAIIRATKSFGGIILTASHNPGGPNEDFGIKYNNKSGGPASEAVTDKIFEFTESIKEYKIASELPDVDLSVVKTNEFDGFTVDVIDSVEIYEQNLRSVFDFDALSTLVKRDDFTMVLDGLNGVVGPYIRKIFGGMGVAESALHHSAPKEDFGGLHPDPNLTYAADLVKEMYTGQYEFGAAFDGDADRNMILGKKFFVTPSDSLAVIADYAEQSIPYFQKGLQAVARSMPTSAAVDRVAKAKNLTLYEVPTGWKFFGNAMDYYESEGTPNMICGEESFGTGSDHVREKDGVWAVLAWLSILAHVNKDTSSGSLVSVGDVVTKHWKKYGRNFYSRYDYEQVDSDKANELMANLVAQQEGLVGKQLGNFTVAEADEFEYKDQFDQSVSSHQGIRFLFSDGSRIVFRLSGTGSTGATIRLYLEQYQDDESQFGQETAHALKDLVSVALDLSKMEEFTGRKEPTVIT